MEHHSLPRQLITSFAKAKMRVAEGHAQKLEGVKGEGLTIASYNVHKCIGTDRRFSPERILQVIGEIQPDIIALQEADQRFGARKGLLDLGLVSAELGLERVPIAHALHPVHVGAAQPFMRVRKRAQPLVVKEQSHGFRGNVLLVKKALVHEVSAFVLPGFEPRGVVMSELEFASGFRLRIVAAHLGLLRWARRQQADFILHRLATLPDCPTVLMGDFNEWRLGPGSALTRFSPAFGPLPQPVPSFPARLPVLALDRILCNRQGLVHDIEVHDSPLARLASDHLPLKAKIACAAMDERAQAI